MRVDLRRFHGLVPGRFFGVWNHCFWKSLERVLSHCLRRKTQWRGSAGIFNLGFARHI